MNKSIKLGIIILVITIFTTSSFLTKGKSVIKINSNKQNYGNSIPVLCYHHIIPGELPETATTNAVIPVREFEEQMQFLYENGYYTLKLKDVENFIYKKRKLPGEKCVLITFDDGYESNYVYALPIMKKYNFNFTIFIMGKETKAENGVFNPDKLSYLTSKQVREMAAGTVEFGNHTYDLHRYIKRFNKAEPAVFSKTEKQLSQDFSLMSQLFKSLDLPEPIAIAYPFGAYNKKILRQAKKHGYKLGFTVQKGRVYQNSDPYKLNRLNIHPRITLKEFQQILEY